MSCSTNFAHCCVQDTSLTHLAIVCESDDHLADSNCVWLVALADALVFQSFPVALATLLPLTFFLNSFSLSFSLLFGFFLFVHKQIIGLSHSRTRVEMGKCWKMLFFFHSLKLSRCSPDLLSLLFSFFFQPKIQMLLLHSRKGTEDMWWKRRLNGLMRRLIMCQINVYLTQTLSCQLLSSKRERDWKWKILDAVRGIHVWTLSSRFSLSSDIH